MPTTTISIPPDVIRKVDAIIKNDDRFSSRSEIIRHALVDFIQKYEAERIVEVKK